jgi:hypothetical protein
MQSNLQMGDVKKPCGWLPEGNPFINFALQFAQVVSSFSCRVILSRFGSGPWLRVHGWNDIDIGRPCLQFRDGGWFDPIFNLTSKLKILEARSTRITTRQDDPPDRPQVSAVELSSKFTQFKPSLRIMSIAPTCKMPRMGAAKRAARCSRRDPPCERKNWKHLGLVEVHSIGTAAAIGTLACSSV